jgi:diaminohydroxyphosphoribosylaminopyrimidine deaminase/5-amino-6-(5-phosphoribosylamino)uracil reductase
MNNDYMREALDLARQGLGRTSPNPAVGAVLVRDGRVVGRGFHTWAGVKHAEVLALEEARENSRGATLYVSLEPCSHHGRTGPCTEELISAGVSRVVAAMPDPNPLVSGVGLRRLREAGLAVEVASEHSPEAERLNEAFVHYMRHGCPLVTLKAAVTLDGKISAPEDNQGWITSQIARTHVQQVRHRSDAIVTGIGTVLADNCLLTDRTGLERSRPLLRIVLDSLLRLPPSARIVTSCNADLLVVTTSAASPERYRALENLGVRIITLDGHGGRTDLSHLLHYLALEKYLSLMIEAGAKVNWAALESEIVDKIYFYYAPKILGGMHSLPVVGGVGRKRRSDAIVFRDVSLHNISKDEFAVEAWLVKGA